MKRPVSAPLCCPFSFLRLYLLTDGHFPLLRSKGVHLKKEKLGKQERSQLKKNCGRARSLGRRSQKGNAGAQGKPFDRRRRGAGASHANRHAGARPARCARRRPGKERADPLGCFRFYYTPIVPDFGSSRLAHPVRFNAGSVACGRRRAAQAASGKKRRPLTTTHTPSSAEAPQGIAPLSRTQSLQAPAAPVARLDCRKSRRVEPRPDRDVPFVLNEVRAEHYFGSMKSAEVVLRSGSGNDAIRPRC